MKDSELVGKHFHFNNEFFHAPLPYGLIDLYQIGELCCERGYEIELHEQPCHEISYVVSGKGVAYVGGEAIPLEEGDILFNHMDYTHAIVADPNNMLRYLYMGFRFNTQINTAEYKEMLDYYNTHKYIKLQDKNDVYIPFARVLEEFSSGLSYSELMIRNYCQEILILTCRKPEKDMESLFNKHKANNALGHLAYTLIKYIENNIYTIESIREISEKIGYSYTYLSHFFSQHTGMSLQRYINMKKIEKAMELLRYSNLSITQIARKLNYDTVQSFSKAFRKVMGFPPSQYLEQTKQKPGQTVKKEINR